MNVALMRLRIPDEVKKWLRDRAADNQRTMNGEVLTMLKSAMEADRRNEKEAA